jgi:hypothetical protein
MSRLQKLAESNVSAKPTLLVTKSAPPWDPMLQLLSLSLVKAAQANMVESLSRAYSDRGVHVGLIPVEGPVAPEARNLNPQSIAEVA